MDLMDSIRTIQQESVQLVVMSNWGDPSNSINTYPWDNGGWGGNQKLVVCGKEYDDEQCGGGSNIGCLSPSCTGPGCANPRDLVPPGTDVWDSVENGGSQTTDHGRSFTLFRLPLGEDD